MGGFARRAYRTVAVGGPTIADIMLPSGARRSGRRCSLERAATSGLVASSCTAWCGARESVSGTAGSWLLFKWLGVDWVTGLCCWVDARLSLELLLVCAARAVASSNGGGRIVDSGGGGSGARARELLLREIRESLATCQRE